LNPFYWQQEKRRNEKLERRVPLKTTIGPEETDETMLKIRAEQRRKEKETRELML